MTKTRTKTQSRLESLQRELDAAHRACHVEAMQSGRPEHAPALPKLAKSNGQNR
jgi:hypothetical protein